jgi:circadian clock protein KaiB
MKAKRKQASPNSYRQTKQVDPDEYYDLRLYVAGQTPKSIAAFHNGPEMTRSSPSPHSCAGYRSRSGKSSAIWATRNGRSWVWNYPPKGGIKDMSKRRHTPRIDGSEAFEKAARNPKAHLFRLYIAGSSHRSLRAVKKIKEICEKELPGLYTLEIIDLYQEPARAITDQIVAAPTLVRRLPEPVRLVGDFSDEQKVKALFQYRNTGKAK